MSDRAPLPLTLANALLFVLFPVVWFAPLMTVSLSFRFWADGSDLSIITILQSLWADDVAMALVLTVFAILAPYTKVMGLFLIHLGLLSDRAHGVLFQIGRLAMADVFLIAVYITVFKTLDVGTITVGWGLYAFTGLVVASLMLSILTERLHRPA